MISFELGDRVVDLSLFEVVTLAAVVTAGVSSLVSIAISFIAGTGRKHD